MKDPYQQSARRQWARKYDPRRDIEVNLTLIDRLRAEIAELKVVKATMYLVPRREKR